jgi:hypothetical protein
LPLVDLSHQTLDDGSARRRTNIRTTAHSPSTTG